jgi:DNA replication protein DnaC
MARRSGLEPHEQEVRLDNWKTPGLSEAYKEQRRQAKKVIKAAIEAEVGLYTFWGDYGAGKSRALQVVVNELRDRGAAGCYAPLGEILEHLRSMYQRGEETSRYWQRLLEIPVLAVDEVTRFNDTGWAREKLFELVDTRYRKRKTHLTLFATNDDPTRSLPTEEALGYLYSRLREGVLVELRGDVRPAVGSSPLSPDGRGDGGEERS